MLRNNNKNLKVIVYVALIFISLGVIASTLKAGVSLEHEMGAMERDFHTIERQVKNSSQNASTLAAVLDMEEHTLSAKSVAPRSATTMPTTAANGEKEADYHAMMINLLREELNLEEELHAGQNDEAVKTVSAMNDLEHEGHDEFRPRRGR
ncbi:MAG: hypothetical protein JO353_12845 [Phycisphaerae bacterium]|nr:hypothetical protein [Phycisphaerae bacterium]